jgi:hypothetical protein
MLFRIHSRNVVGYDGTEHDIVYLVSSVDTLRREGFACVHTDGQANARFTNHVQGLDEIASTVDWSVIRGKMWNNTAAQPDRMRRRSAEVLVRDFVPFSVIEGIAVPNASMAQRVHKVLKSFTLNRPVVEKPGWYYGRAPQ